ncbi:hypothetical protein [uncultured Dokdonia sp.]|uniref:hypothetical protein n=1 Tax=uncultured Dokdonia sp. TaxID=575653 RepID=UPI00260A7B15|nr:hypothetical protein [uncultured Dokdonia sp.]
MKRYMIYALLLLIGIQVNAQEDIATTVIKLKDLITHAADAYPNEEPQQIYLLIETGASGISSDHRFYLEQGIQLLLKRLQPEDKIAIGTYGGNNTTIVSYTEASNSDHILKELQKIYTITNQDEGKDGIDMAYQFAKNYYVEDTENKVIMMRNDQVASQSIAADSKNDKEKKHKKTRAERKEAGQSYKLGGAIAITALSILPEVLEVIKD